jgi:Na+-transporting NADH:ubiquinone oxidoreductase subunit NqrC
MKKLTRSALSIIVSLSALSLSPTHVFSAVAPEAAYSVQVDAIATSGLKGVELEAAVKVLINQLVADVKAGKISAAAAAKLIAQLSASVSGNVSPEFKAALDGIVAALNAGEDIPALAASQA